MHSSLDGFAPDRISICVCTYRRPSLLFPLLEALAGQLADKSFRFEIVVVDNDSDRSAEHVVRRAAALTTVPIVYDCEPERNISLARNRAIANASGSLIAFIDDDELPKPDWLRHLHHTLTKCRADGVLGPVVAHFPNEAPAWLRKGRLFTRRRLETGARIGPQDARTGNVLLRRSLVENGGTWFDPAFGRTGGEDTDFFARQFAAGRAFVWCDQADVTETLPPDRWTVKYHVRRLLRAGTIDGERMRAGTLAANGLVVRNAVIFCACAVLTPPALLLPRHRWIRVAQKLAYSGGVVTAYCGVSLYRDRE